MQQTNLNVSNIDGDQYLHCMFLFAHLSYNEGFNLWRLYWFHPKPHQLCPQQTFQPILSSQQTWTLKCETHTLLCAGLDPVCCHPGPEPRIQWEKKGDRWKKGRGKKINEFLSSKVDLRSWSWPISFQFKGTLLRTFLFSLSCTGLTKQVFVSLSLKMLFSRSSYLPYWLHLWLHLDWPDTQC